LAGRGAPRRRGAPGRAKFYPSDDELLAQKDAHADHYEVIEADLEPRAMGPSA
jgi:hypothetical protein